jgi:hypothetical protein
MSDGGFALTGMYHGSEGWQMLVLRTDMNGDTLWTRRIENSLEGTSIAIDKDGNIVAGGLADTDSSDELEDLLDIRRGQCPIVVKLNQDGDLIWYRNYDSSHLSLFDLAALPSGNICFLGGSTGNAELVMLNSNGDSLWAHPVYGYSMQSLDRTMEGGFVVGGFNMYLPDTDKDGIVVKTTPSGSEEWRGTWGNYLSPDEFKSVIETSDGGYICAGRSGSMGSRGWLVRIAPETGIESEMGFNEYPSLSIAPNPFTSILHVSFILPESGFVDLSVFDVMGRRIEQLNSDYYPTGKHHSVWTPSSDSHAGCYFIVLDTAAERSVVQSVLLR